MSLRLGPFRHRPFAVYWAGGFVSNIGTWLQTVAASVFVYQLTGSPLAVGTLNFIGFLPIVLFSISGGVVSDRFDRRTVVIITHVISGGLAAVLAMTATLGLAGPELVMATAFALSTTYAFGKPALIALIPSLVPRDELTDAVGLNSLQFILGQLTGPTLAALLLATTGAPVAFGLNAATYLAPILSMAYLRRLGLGATSNLAGAGRSSSAADVGLAQFVARNPWIFALLVGVVASSAPLEVVRTLAPAFVAEQLSQPESVAGLLIAAQSAGSALALLGFVPLRRRGQPRRVSALGLGLQAAGLLMTASALSLPQAALGVGLVGFGFSLTFPILTGALQEALPDRMRGRIMAVHQMAHLGNRPFTALAAGTLASLLATPAALAVAVALAPVGLLATQRARLPFDTPPVAAHRDDQVGEALRAAPEP